MRVRALAVSALLLILLAGCAGSPAAPASAPPSATEDHDDHGHVEGAVELAEPALHLATIDGDGVVRHLDLLDESVEVLDEIAPVEELVSDGRYLFAIRAGSVTVIDSGVWSWSHVDHFHYYEAPSRTIGEIEGSGVAVVVRGETGTGILFDDEAVLIDTPALGDAEIVELFRSPLQQHDGMVVPLAEGAAITEPDADGAVRALRVVDADGTPGERIECIDAAGTITTVVGVVVGCSDGAVMAAGGDGSNWERIPYPDGAAVAAEAFAAREGRPRVAALAGTTALWLLDTRARTWTLHDIGEELVDVVATDDAEQHVIALAADGSVLVLSDGGVVARTEPLVADSLADPAAAAGISFVVDQHRTYLNGPTEQLMWEIDHGDGARIARVFDTETAPLHLAGTGR